MYIVFTKKLTSEAESERWEVELTYRMPLSLQHRAELILFEDNGQITAVKDVNGRLSSATPKRHRVCYVITHGAEEELSPEALHSALDAGNEFYDLDAAHAALEAVRTAAGKVFRVEAACVAVSNVEVVVQRHAKE